MCLHNLGAMVPLFLGSLTLLSKVSHVKLSRLLKIFGSSQLLTRFIFVCVNLESVYQSHRGPWTVFVDKSARFYSADSEPRSPDSPLPTMSPGPSDTPQDPTVSPDSDSPRSDTGPQSPQPSQPSPRESGTGPTWTVDRGPWTIGHEFRKTTELFGKGVNMSLHAYIHIHTTLTHANHPPIHPSVRSCTQIT